VSIVAFEAWHADQILAGRMNDEKNRPSFEFGQLSDKLVIADHSFTAIEDGEVIGAGGIYPLWPGVGEAWVVAAEATSRHKVLIARAVLGGLHALVERHGFHRVQAVAHVDWPAANRFLQWLGFEHEGRCKKYDAAGNDYERWAYIDG